MASTQNGKKERGTNAFESGPMKYTSTAMHRRGVCDSTLPIVYSANLAVGECPNSKKKPFHMQQCICDELNPDLSPLPCFLIHNK